MHAINSVTAETSNRLIANETSSEWRWGFGGEVQM